MAALPVLLLMGPTGAGKTDLALELVTRHPLEIVSVDSAMVYRGMDIGTGKPSREILARVPHHLVDVADPAEVYSAGRFVRDVRALIAAIHGRGRVPLLVGGTLLYFRALTRGLAELPAADPAVRAELTDEGDRLGWPALHARLATLDPLTAARLQPKDAQRIQRALEVIHLTGRPLSWWHGQTRPAVTGVRFVPIALQPADREVLYGRIERRFHAMIRAGFIEEVAGLHARADLHAELPAMRSVGYRQLLRHVSGDLDRETAIREGLLATRHLARRQLVWLRAENGCARIEHLDSGVTAQMNAMVTQALS